MLLTQIKTAPTECSRILKRHGNHNNQEQKEFQDKGHMRRASIN